MVTRHSAFLCLYLRVNCKDLSLFRQNGEFEKSAFRRAEIEAVYAPAGKGVVEKHRRCIGGSLGFKLQRIKFVVFIWISLDELAAAIPAGSDGMTFLPYLCGSTMPKYNPAARGSFTGLTTEHTRGHFVRSVMESVACMLRSNLEYLGLDVDEIRAMGGGASSPLWCQMKADMTGKRLVTLKNKETACLGSAILAGVGIGVFESVEKAAESIEIDRVYDSQGVDYTECYERHLAYDKILNVTD